MRICSLLPTATEMLYALGLGKSIVARSQHCNYPPEVKTKPVVVASRVKKIARQDSLAIHKAVMKLRQENAHQFTIDLPALKRLKPDLVITQELCNVCAASHSEVFAALKQISPQPQVLSIEAQRLGELFTDLKRLAHVTGRHRQADQLIEQFQKRIEQTRESLRHIPSRPRVWCCEWLEPLMAAGHWIPELVELAGGLDGLGVTGKNSVWLTWGQIRSYNPEVIVIMPCSYSISQTLRERARLTKRPGWKSLSAVKNGRAFAVDGSFYHHAGPRLLDGLELFAHLFHPDHLPAGRLRRSFRLLL